MTDLKVVLQERKVFIELKKSHTDTCDSTEVDHLKSNDSIRTSVKNLLGTTDDTIANAAFDAAKTRIASKANNWNQASDFFPDLKDGIIDQLSTGLTGGERGKLSAILDQTPNKEDIVDLAQKVADATDVKAKSVLVADFITTKIAAQTATDNDATVLLAKLKPVDPPPPKPADPKAITVSGKIKAGETKEVSLDDVQLNAVKEDAEIKKGEAKTVGKLKFQLKDKDGKVFLLITPANDAEGKQEATLGGAKITVDVEKKAAEEPGKGVWAHIWRNLKGYGAGVAALVTLFTFSKAEDTGYLPPAIGAAVTVLLGLWQWVWTNETTPAPPQTGAAKTA